MFVSIVIAAYNAEPFLCELMDSILAQTHEDFEAVIVDDGSTDRSLEILRGYEQRDARIRVISQENQGASAARNTAIEAARAEWIALMDADDTMEPNRLERQIVFVQDHPELALAASMVIHIDAGGRELGRSVPTFTTDESIETAKQRGEVIGFHQNTVLMRKDVFEHVGGYRHEFWPGEDMDLWNRIVYAGYNVRVQPEYLVRYRVHGSSASVQTRQYRENVRWIHQCIFNRQRGLPEPSKVDFLRAQRSQPLLRRLNVRRLDTSWILYRNATIYFATGKRLNAIWAIARAVILDPVYVFPRLWRLVSSRLASNNSGSRAVSSSLS